MPSSPFDLILILTLAWLLLAVDLLRVRARVRRLERIAGVRSRRRRKHLPKQSHIRTIPVRVEKKRAG